MSLLLAPQPCPEGQGAANQLSLSRPAVKQPPAQWHTKFSLVVSVAGKCDRGCGMPQSEKVGQEDFCVRALE